MKTGIELIAQERQRKIYKEELLKLGDIMLQFGEIHSMVSKTGLASKDYAPISISFAKARVELYSHYAKLKKQQSK